MYDTATTILSRNIAVAIVPHLIADQFGSHVGKYSERLKVTQKGETLAQAPLLHLASVHVLSMGVSVSADALEACCERGIPIYFLDGRGTPYASIYSAGLTGTVITRREQLRAYDDWRGMRLGLRIAEGKIQNQAITLKYLSKTRKDTPDGDELRLAAGDVLAHLSRLDALEDRTLEAARSSLMAVEGNAAQVYWAAVRPVIPEAYGWERREGRGATDPVNSLLNYGYGILYGQIERALVLAGLDPYAGFIHVDRPGKPSLTLDLIEEFRQVAVDRVVWGLVARNFTVEQNDKGQLSEETRRGFADHIIQHLESGVRYEGERYPLRQVIQMQARRVAAFLRQDRDDYVPFKAEW
jgi:CRISPR-associated protein Cas1